MKLFSFLSYEYSWATSHLNSIRSLPRDLLIRVFVETPTRLSPRQKELLQEFGESEGPNNLPKRKGFLDKIKGFFST